MVLWSGTVAVLFSSFIYGLFNDADGSPDWIASNDGLINEQWIEILCEMELFSLI
jgi:hypothetical protein